MDYPVVLLGFPVPQDVVETMTVDTLAGFSSGAYDDPDTLVAMAEFRKLGLGPEAKIAWWFGDEMDVPGLHEKVRHVYARTCDIHLPETDSYFWIDRDLKVIAYSSGEDPVGVWIPLEN